MTAPGTSSVFLTLLPLWVKYCGEDPFVQVDGKKLRLSCENLSQTVSFKQQIIRLEKGSRLHPLQFFPVCCVFPVLAVVEDLSKAVAGSVRSCLLCSVMNPSLMLASLCPCKQVSLQPAPITAVFRGQQHDSASQNQYK